MIDTSERGLRIMQHRSTATATSGASRRRTTALALASMFATAGTAYAFEIDTGNPDVTLRWDNTLRYNLGVRAESRDRRSAIP
jgi:hypothetical protein